LAGIALGTWLGGVAADRVDPRRLVPACLVVGGALAIATVPIVRTTGDPTSRPDAGSIVVLATLAFFAPSAVLSAVSPMVVKLQLATVAEAGRVVGTFSALGTAGSLVGVFATGFVLVAAF